MLPSGLPCTQSRPSFNRWLPVTWAHRASPSPADSAPLRLASLCPFLPGFLQPSGRTRGPREGPTALTPLSSVPSVLLRPGAAVGPGRGQAAQERQRGDSGVRPRRALQAGAVPPVHRLLLVRPRGHRTPHPRHVHQVALRPRAGRRGREAREGAPAVGAAVTGARPQTSLCCPDSAVGLPRTRMAPAVGTWSTLPLRRPPGAASAQRGAVTPEASGPRLWPAAVGEAGSVSSRTPAGVHSGFPCSACGTGSPAFSKPKEPIAPSGFLFSVCFFQMAFFSIKSRQCAKGELSKSCSRV